MSAPGENVYGLELSGAGSKIKGHVAGISLCLIGGVKNRVTGIVGTLGYNAARDVTGLQFGAFNSTYRTAGIQAGFENRASELEGLQIGIFNGSRDDDVDTARNNSKVSTYGSQAKRITFCVEKTNG